MFSGSKSSANQPHKDYFFSALYPTKFAKDIYTHEIYKDHLEKIKIAAAYTEEGAYDELFTSLLNDFAEFVQMIPDPRQGNQPMLHVGLARCVAAVQKVSGNQGLDDRTKYAIFSASLLLFLGTVHVDFKVMVSDEKGAFKYEWSPFYHRFSDPDATYYKVRPVTGSPTALIGLVTPILAQKLMPHVGMEWLAEDPVLLMQWIRVLSRLDGTGILGQTLDSIEDDLYTILKAFEGIVVEHTLPKETELGEAFWEWIQEKVQSGGLKVNTKGAPLQMTKEGLLIDIDLLAKEFVGSYARSINWIVVRQQYNMLGLAPLSGQDYKFKQFFSEGPGSTKGSPGSGKLLSSKGSTLFGAKNKSQISKLGKQGMSNAVAKQMASSPKNLSGQLLSNAGLLLPAGQATAVAKGVRATAPASSAMKGLQQRQAARNGADVGGVNPSAGAQT